MVSLQKGTLIWYKKKRDNKGKVKKEEKGAKVKGMNDGIQLRIQNKKSRQKAYFFEFIDA